MATPPTPHITVLLKNTKSAINQALNTPETLNFISGILWDGFIGTAFKIRQWAWHSPLLGENPYLEICLTDFNQIRCMILFSYLYVIVWKWAKSNYNHAYFPYNTILNSIWFFDFPLCILSNNDYIGVKLCVNNTFKVCHLVTKNCLNRTETVQAPMY